jgi:hypothetical protein
MKVQLTILIQITISWLPGTWFVLMMPFLQNPAYYLVGFASSALAMASAMAASAGVPNSTRCSSASTTF